MQVKSWRARYPEKKIVNYVDVARRLTDNSLYCDMVNLFGDEPKRKFPIISGYTSELFKLNQNQHSSCAFDRGYVREAPVFAPPNPKPTPIIEDEVEGAADEQEDEIVVTFLMSRQEDNQENQEEEVVEEEEKEEEEQKHPHEEEEQDKGEAKGNEEPQQQPEEEPGKFDVTMMDVFVDPLAVDVGCELEEARTSIIDVEELVVDIHAQQLDDVVTRVEGEKDGKIYKVIVLSNRIAIDEGKEDIELCPNQVKLEAKDGHVDDNVEDSKLMRRRVMLKKKKNLCPRDFTPPSFDLGIESTFDYVAAVGKIVQERKVSKIEVSKSEDFITLAVNNRLPKKPNASSRFWKVCPINGFNPGSKTDCKEAAKITIKIVDDEVGGDVWTLLVSDFGPKITIKIVESLREDIWAGKLKSGTEVKSYTRSKR
ncbi:hypothetical protein V2J09_021619 [Rumex salicifolius]